MRAYALLQEYRVRKFQSAINPPWYRNDVTSEMPEGKEILLFGKAPHRPLDGRGGDAEEVRQL